MTMNGLSGMDINDANAVAVYYETHAIPQRFDAGIIVASIVVAIMGAYASLYLLGRRTSNSGKRNIVLLISAATTMAFVGIWSMHFIGMYMRLEATPYISWYIRYNPGFAAFSFIAPAIALIVSFLFLDHDTDGFRFWKAILAGTLTGCTVALMHYSASFYCNFNVTFAPAQVVGSILLACVLCIVGFTAFFRFRYQWQDSWWKRGACAMCIGMGVSGMHYVGVSGTSYKVKTKDIQGWDLTTGKRRNLILVCVIAALCFTILSAIAVVALVDALMQRKLRRKARMLVVASATFDRNGRLMVNGDGTLPLITVEEKTLRRSQVLQALGQRSNIFHWLYAISWKWSIVSPFLEAIGNKASDAEQKKGYNAGQRTILARYEKAKRALRRGSKDISDYPLESQTSLFDFRDKVVDAANRLAQELAAPLSELGVFYDQVLPTGTRKAMELAQAKDPFGWRQSGSIYSDDETRVASRPPSIFGKGEDETEGVTMFVVREIQQDEVNRLAKRGYRFTETRFLGNILADRHGVIKEEMDATLEGLQQYAKRGIRPIVQPGGYYAGLFCVRPNSTQNAGNLDVLVYDFARHQVPAFRLPSVTSTTSEILDFLKSMDQTPMENVLQQCSRDSNHLQDQKRRISKLLENNLKAEDQLRLQEEQEAIDSLMQFQQSLFTAITTLQQTMYFFPELLQKATFSSKMVELPSSLTDPEAAPAHLVLMQAILPQGKLPRPNQGFEPNLPLVFVPYSLFAKTQMMMLGGPPAEEFERQVISELERRYKLQTTSTIAIEPKTFEDELASKKSDTSSVSTPASGPDTHVLMFNGKMPDLPSPGILGHRLSVLGEESLVIGDDSVCSTPAKANKNVEAALLKKLEPQSPDKSRHIRSSSSSSSLKEMPVKSNSSAEKSSSLQSPNEIKGGPESPLGLLNSQSCREVASYLSGTTEQDPTSVNLYSTLDAPKSDHWQTQQLEEMKKKQPDLLLGIKTEE